MNTGDARDLLERDSATFAKFTIRDQFLQAKSNHVCVTNLEARRKKLL